MTDIAACERKIALVVEGDDDQRAMVTCLMEESDLQVVECTSAEAAISVMRLTGRQVAVVFTDIRLSGDRTGVDLAHAVASEWPDTGIIVTSSSEPDRALPARAVYLRKPWRALDVLARVA